mgnify:CR=1 FL=1
MATPMPSPDSTSNFRRQLLAALLSLLPLPYALREDI